MFLGLHAHHALRQVAFVASVASAFWSGATAPATAETPCPGNAPGISRVLNVSAKDTPRLGLMQYRRSLPLADREVVLTFDDGPLPHYTERVLDILAAHCLKATFFLVGRHTAAHPELAQRIRDEGHTIGNHSQNHSLHFNALGRQRGEAEVVVGAQTIANAVGGEGLSSFVRIPGLNRTAQIEAFAHGRDLVVWSADVVADDWRRISSDQVMQIALRRLEARGKGILLLHDIQPRTVLMLPKLLDELQRRRFKIVHAIADEPAPRQPESNDKVLVAEPALKRGWPRLLPLKQIAAAP